MNKQAVKRFSISTEKHNKTIYLAYLENSASLKDATTAFKYSVHKKNRDSQNVVILVPKINIKVTPRLLDI